LEQNHLVAGQRQDTSAFGAAGDGVWRCPSGTLFGHEHRALVQLVEVCEVSAGR